jgi:feruloyl esterase
MMMVVAVLCVVASSPAWAATCEGLSSMTIANGAVTLAQTVRAGEFRPPAGRVVGTASAADAYAQLPEFCRVAATLKPSPRSGIKIEVWLPMTGWNGRLQVVGNGGFAGTISYAAMARALAAGYATASTDTGHVGPVPAKAYENEDVIIDYAHRAVHETAAAAKAVVKTFAGNAPTFSYFNGCSTGGRQAMTAAQRYPSDFDGIIAGAPAMYASRQFAGQIWIWQATSTPETAMPIEARRVLNQGVMAACDELDGVKDGVLENPQACRFDPQVLVCKPGDDPATCLTPAQGAAVTKAYAGASNPRTGEKIYPGLERGSELGWLTNPVGDAVGYFRFRVFGDPNWDPRTLNFDADMARTIGSPSNLLFDANDPNLTPFTSRGGKLILYQGWAEPGIPPGHVVHYYNEARTKTSNADRSIRLFMVPGMGHCGGGNGTSAFDMAAALDGWVTTNTPPASIPASRVRDGKVPRPASGRGQGHGKHRRGG